MLGFMPQPNLPSTGDRTYRQGNQLQLKQNKQVRDLRLNKVPVKVGWAKPTHKVY